ncbi:FAD-binding domain-containing protein [Parasulfitobacter algicola]|uniref:Deoxyribodipyrimidine photo-lyase n=1 Tax=Parasulfitobacter algicola TaxID=2614809 RepID=A0ABX2IU91_9RHOB|nr:FAD-binding domain-containing protein [Sulfitobacter algicola]NSX53618.1 deoxyribodipyrimidine photo-lyase [Sulfitobacter algicola]
MTTLLWFKRDLRIYDHPALASINGDISIIPLFVVEPEYWQLPDTSARQYQFIAESLQSLRGDLAQLGAPLIVRVGDVLDVLNSLHHQHELIHMVSHEETGNLWTFRRDQRVAAWARQKSIQWDEYQQSGVVRRLPGRDGWAARREKFVRQPCVNTPKTLKGIPIDAGAIPSARDLGLVTDTFPERQPGGRDSALTLLDGFLTKRGLTYRKAMSSPVQGEWACSRLSPHLAVGTLSMRETVQVASARKIEVKGTRDGWAGSLKSFTSRLAWRDHFMQKLEDAPRIETHCLHSAYENQRPRTPDATRLQAWETGETGLPFVDACMRYLNATGWLNFRMRSMLMAVASYHLWLDWRSSGPHLARMFTDYEPGIHWSQCQMQAGTTGMNTIRIYNPVKQGYDQDPTGVFTRRWVPELADVPDQFLQEPWRWENAAKVLGRKYPNPIVDVKSAAATARDKVWAVRKGDHFQNEAAQIVEKHASRKDSARNFVDDRAPKRKPRKTDDAQLKLDL